MLDPVDLPVSIGAMSAIPPAVRYLVLEVTAGNQLDQLPRLIEVGTPWLGADPELAAVGLGLLEARHAPPIREAACAWLAMFPTEETIERLAAVATDPATPPGLRTAAIEALADRQLRGRHPSTRWSAETVQLADDALFKVADAATATGRIAPELAHALRHVHSDALAAVFARAPSLWGEALECFATAPLARVLFVSLDDIQPRHRVRVLRVIAATLGDAAVPLMLARAGHHAASLDERLESLFLAISFGGEAHLPRLEDALREHPHADFQRKRARWHLGNHGVVPTVRGLRVARSFATLPVEERARRATQAADDLAALARFARHGDPAVYELWTQMVRAAGDPFRAQVLLAARPAAAPAVNELVIHDLARRGKVGQVIAAAQHAPDVGALALAIWGRPFAALQLASIARTFTPTLACARVLACYRAGRADLAERLLVEDPPPVAVTDDETPARFPGADERWRAEHASATHVAIAALVRGREGVVALAQPAHHDADPDVTSVGVFDAIEQRLDRTLRGKLVCLAGELKASERAAVASVIEQTGARVAAGPIPGTELYLAGDHAARAVSYLERQGARRLRPDEIEGL